VYFEVVCIDGEDYWYCGLFEVFELWLDDEVCVWVV